MFIKLKNVKKVYQMGDISITAAKSVNFEIEKGELVIILGASGAGKTTILNIIGGMDRLTSGSVIVDNKEIHKLDDRELTRYRRDDIGFIFQFYNLVGNLTALENIELTNGISKDHLDAKEVLKQVGLANRMNNFPSQLSGGEQQRVAIARAIAKKPKLLLCDEPTGALDSITGQKVLETLQDASRKHNMTVLIITHNQAIAPIADKVITMRNATVESIKINKNPKDIREIKW